MQRLNAVTDSTAAKLEGSAVQNRTAAWRLAAKLEKIHVTVDMSKRRAQHSVTKFGRTMKTNLGSDNGTRNFSAYTNN